MFFSKHGPRSCSPCVFPLPLEWHQCKVELTVPKPRKITRQQRKTKLSELHLSDCHLADFEGWNVTICRIYETFLGITCVLPRSTVANYKQRSGVFLWENPDQDFWSVAFLWSKSVLRSVIYQIHSGQGFTGSLICVIWRRIIGTLIQRVPLGDGFENNHFAIVSPTNYDFAKRCSISNM